MKRVVAIAMAALLASEGCALRSGQPGGAPGRPPFSQAGASSSPTTTPRGGDFAGAIEPRLSRRTSSQQRSMPMDAAAWEKYLRGIPVGAKVKVTLSTGETLKGVFMGLENGQVTVRPRTRIPEPVRVVTLTSLGWIELDQGASVAKTIGIAAAVAGATVVTIFVILIASIDD